MNIIVAAAENNAIGNKGTMPWHLRADLQYFKKVTMGHAVIMGRKTFESIGRPLPGRHNIIITRAKEVADSIREQYANAEMKPGTQVTVCNDIDEALALAPEDVFVIGGAQIYNQLWDKASRIYLTRVHTTIEEFDASVPEMPALMHCTYREDVAADDQNDYPVTFEVWDRYEIMAPVGCFESLAAAIQAGAGSIYFGIQGLNMRSASANNFTIEDLKKVADICRQNGMKSYLTVNTIIYGEDLTKMRNIIDAASEAGISAIIASDLAAITYARGLDRGGVPRIEVHLSTQLNISNVEALRFYAQYADVAVLARELNMTQVKEIHEAIKHDNICGPAGQPVRIEMFAHGALCMAVSGKCYMSLHEYNRSANRGACAQVCRHAYDAFAEGASSAASTSANASADEQKYLLKDQDHDIQLEIDNKYIMSPKDLKTIHFLDKMEDAGVEVYKIEGRARGPEYVKTVVSCYREAFEAIAKHKKAIISQHNCETQEASLPDNWEELVKGWDERLSKVFNRGFWNGYYLGQRLGEWSNVYGSKATEHKEYAAKVVGWFSKIGIGDFQCEAVELHKGDQILIIGPTTGVIEMTLDEIQVDYQVVTTIKKGDRFTIPVKQKIRPSDKVYVIVKN